MFVVIKVPNKMSRYTKGKESLFWLMVQGDTVCSRRPAGHNAFSQEIEIEQKVEVGYKTSRFLPRLLLH